MAFRPYQTFVEPLLALLLRRRRLAVFGLADRAVPRIAIDWRRAGECRDPCPTEKRRIPRLVRRYAGCGAARLMPMVIALAAVPDAAPMDAAAFDAELKARSSRTLPKIRKAERAGYGARPFLLPTHVHDMHAIRTSMPLRTAGPVMDCWFLKPEHIATPATGPMAFFWPTCPTHWEIWWGVFLPEPGHMQGMVNVGERLIAYVRLWRLGDIVHYREIMGHRDHLDAGVMQLLHRSIVRWLIAGEEEAARGVKVVLYGALEHGREGLVTWKKRAGFKPMRLIEVAVDGLDREVGR